MSQNKHSLRYIIELAAVIISIFVACLIVDDFINRRIENKINDDIYLDKLSINLRPFLIFDDDHKYIYDHGALKYIKDIEIFKAKSGDIDSMIVILNRFSQAPPTLECLGPNSYSFITKRGQKYKWHFNAYAPSILGGKYSNTFKLELLR